MVAHQSGADNARLRSWERATEWPLTFAALLFLGAYAWPILDTQLAGGWRDACRVLTYGVWALFLVEFCARLVIVERRVHYCFRHLPEIAVIVLPLLRPLRLLRLVMLLNVFNRQATISLRGRIAVYVVGSTALLVVCAALAALDAERGHQGANIQTFGGALWWAVATITTVGYGDRYPITADGRLLAVGLMIGGIALLGVVTASFASWLLDHVLEAEEDTQAATVADVKALLAEVAELKAMLQAEHRRAREDGPVLDEPGRAQY